MSYVGSVGCTDEHSHHAWQIMLTAETLGMVAVDGRHLDAHDVMIAPGSRHQIITPHRAVMMFIDPSSLAGRRLRTVPTLDAAPASVQRLPSLHHDVDSLLTARMPDRSQIESLVECAINAITDPSASHASTLHPSVNAALQILDDPAPDRSGASVDAIASRVGLSPSRLIHLFSDQVGTPIRSYARWLRLKRAASMVIAGKSITDAAHHAGFSDAAHFSRTFRSSFGLTPTQALRGVRWIP